jgi:predicted NAD-dependent protein-ADP-ribosyltransferase YbiA (DUF1768 family)
VGEESAFSRLAKNGTNTTDRGKNLRHRSFSIALEPVVDSLQPQDRHLLPVLIRIPDSGTGEQPMGNITSISDSVVIRKVAEPFGWLSNMSPHPVLYRGYTFQCLRFSDEEIQTLIWDQASPMAAKMIAKKYRQQMVVAPRSQQDVENMELVVMLKTDQHPIIEEQLLATGDRFIVEDCTKRASASGRFWGARFHNGQWDGENQLGRLWMSLRSQIQHGEW